MHYFLGALRVKILRIQQKQGFSRCGAFLGSLSSEGCEEGWLYFRDYCYSFIPGQVHFDTALDICSVVKKSTLVTLWTSEEYDFVLNNLKQVRHTKNIFKKKTMKNK